MVGCGVGQERGRGEVAAGYRYGVGSVLNVKMPNTKRRQQQQQQRITARDLEVLEFVARYGVIPRDVVGLWAGTGRAVTAARERRLRVAGLVEVLAGFGNSGRLCLCTRRGLRATGRDELPAPRFSLATAHHSAMAARVGAQLELGGHQVLSEREIFARERAEGRRIFSAELSDGRLHRPDLVVVGDVTQAIEVELTDKSARRLDQLLRAWRLAITRRRFGAVRYLCGPRALRYVRRAASRTRADGLIAIDPLESGGGLPSVAVGRSPFGPDGVEAGRHLSL